MTTEREPRNGPLRVCQCLNPDFQDWMAEEGLLSRSNQSLRLLEDDLSKFGSLGYLRADGRLLSTLLRRRGYLLDAKYLANKIYPDPVSLTEEGVSYLAVTWFRLKKVVSQPDLLYRKIKVGMGAGISGLSLSYGELRLLYPLWRNLERFLPSSTLGLKLYGVSDDSVGRCIPVGICRLRERLDGSHFWIESRRTPISYRLTR